MDIPEALNDAEAGEHLLSQYVLVHLGEDNEAKFNLLVLMLRKLYGFVKGDVAEDNPDSLMNQVRLPPQLLQDVDSHLLCCCCLCMCLLGSQELLLAGHLYCIFLKEKIAEMLQGVEALMKR